MTNQSTGNPKPYVHPHPCDPIFTRGALLDTTRLQGFKTDMVCDAAASFSSSLVDIQRLLSIPIALACQGVIAGRLTHVALMGYLIQMVPQERRDEAQKQFKREVIDQETGRRLVHELANDPMKTVPKLPGGDGEILDFIARDPGAQTNFRLILSFAISSGWTAFEIMTTDLWTALVNRHAKKLVGRLSHDLKNREKPTAVSLNALGEHDFDISERLGTLLAPHFDFTSLEGMRIAFEAIFGKNSCGEFMAEELMLLNAYRNAIVHRGGKADFSFISMTKSNIQPGAVIQLKGTDVERMLNGAILKGAWILSVVDKWVGENQ